MEYSIVLQSILGRKSDSGTDRKLFLKLPLLYWPAFPTHQKPFISGAYSDRQTFLLRF